MPKALFHDRLTRSLLAAGVGVLVASLAVGCTYKGTARASFMYERVVVQAEPGSVLADAGAAPSGRDRPSPSGGRSAAAE